LFLHVLRRCLRFCRHDRFGPTAWFGAPCPTSLLRSGVFDWRARCLFKFKLPRLPRPAWDFQYVLRKLERGKEYGFKARLVWKKFVSPEDCLKEYEAWAGSRR
jgi:hypothetical protein